MSFKAENLILIGGEGKKNRQYLYINTDGDDITATDYFNQTNLAIGTQITSVTGASNSSREEYYISSKTGMNSTATKTVVSTVLYIGTNFRFSESGTDLVLEQKIGSNWEEVKRESAI